MRRAEWLQEVKKMRFEEVYGGWLKKQLTQEEAARILGVVDRTFRRYVDRYDDGGIDALLDKRISQLSHRKAPVDEVMAMTERYKDRYSGWNVRHFHSFYRQEGGTRGYTWVKNQLQGAKLVSKAAKRGPHRKRRDPAPLTGMIIHQDGSTHEWVPGQKWDLIDTMDDATSEHYSMFFVPEEGTHSSFRGVEEVIRTRGLFSSIYTDRGSHYWITPEVGGKVDRVNLTQFGRAMKQLGIEMIPAYSPEARGRSERMFETHQDRLVKELALYGITDMEAANHYLRDVYQPAFNAEFMRSPREEGSAFVGCIGTDLSNILCEQFGRTVDNVNTVSFDGMKLQIPADKHRCNYVKTRVRVHRYIDQTLSIFHGPRQLARYEANGSLVEKKKKAVA